MREIKNLEKIVDFLTEKHLATEETECSKNVFLSIWMEQVYKIHQQMFK